jgi:hypothetical protein
LTEAFFSVAGAAAFFSTTGAAAAVVDDLEEALGILTLGYIHF